MANTTFGEFCFYTNVSRTIGDKNLHGVLNPGEGKLYDLVLDMNYQVYGKSDRPIPPRGGPPAPDNLSIQVSNVAGNLVILVTNTDELDSPLNGVYYNAPAANIKSLTIRGSSDNESILITGPLGLSGSKSITLEGGGGKDFFQLSGLKGATPGGDIGRVTIDGGAGSDGVFISDSAATGDGHHYTAEATPGWDMRLSRGTNSGPPANPIQGTEAIDSKGVENYTLVTGSGSDLIRVDAVPAALTGGLFIIAGAGNDEIHVGSVADGLKNVNGFVAVAGGDGFDRLIVDDAKGAPGGKYTVTAKKIERDGGPRILNADTLFRSLNDSQGGTNNNLSGIPAGPEAGLAITGDDGVNVVSVDGINSGAVLSFDGAEGVDRLEVVAGQVTDPDLTNVETGEVTGGRLTITNRDLTLETYTQTGGTLARTPTGAAGGATLAVTEAVTLAGALRVILPPGFAAAAGTVLGIIDNQGDLPVVGTFDGLPEGGRIRVGGTYFLISYAGNDGNDVVLTAVSGSVSGLAWEDTNGDGVRQGGAVPEPVRAGVTVTLTDAGGTSLTTTTDANGRYKFVGLAAGAYTVTVGSTGRLTAPDQGTNDNRDSDFDPVSRSAFVVLADGQTATRIDAGFLVNSTPVAVDDIAATLLNTAVSVDVLANDSDPNGDALAVAAVTQGTSGGTVTITGGGTGVTYTPARASPAATRSRTPPPTGSAAPQRPQSR